MKQMVIRVHLFSLLLLSLVAPAIGQTNASVQILTQAPSVTGGGRLSQWLLNEQKLQNTSPQNYTSETPYPIGTTWQTPQEITNQEIDKQSVLNALEKIDFPDNAQGKKSKTAFIKFINSMQVTGRVVLPNVNARYLEVNPKLDPILQAGDQVTVPPTPTTITVIRSNGSLCNIRYRPNIEVRFYVQGCKLRSDTNERDPDWAWIVEPDGSVHKTSMAAWNSSKQVLPAPGSWIWAPPRWSDWSGSKGEEFSKALVTMLSAQGPSGLRDSLDNMASSRGSLPSDDPKVLYSVSRDLPISANIWGETGLMQTPSARTAPAGTGAITLGWFNPYTNINLFFSPIDELEFIMRYTNMNNVVYGASGGSQTNKDKSVGLKLKLLNENYYLPGLAVGVRDALGTGLFSGEYVVANKRVNNFDVSAGMGWGQLGTRNNVTNPFVTAFGQNFATRSTGTSNQGGTPTGQFFHGTSALFGGVQYHTPWENLVLKLEVDGNNYQKLPYGQTLPNKSVFNYGATYQTKNADFTLGVMGNSQVMFTISLHERLDLLNTPKLAEAKPVAVDLKNVGSYSPNALSNPAILIDGAKPNSNTKTSVNNITASTSSTYNAPVIAQTKKTNAVANAVVDEQKPKTDLLEVGNSSPTKTNPYPTLGKQNITSAYNGTLVDFEQQTQWQVKGLQGTNNVWTIHLLDASGVFLRSRINRGVAVLHRDAPSNIDTFQVQFYNWGMLVSEFKIDRKQWMLNQTQLLPPSQTTPSITTENTGTLPADGGNPFFRGSNSLSLGSPISDGNSQSNIASTEPLMIDELKHSPLQTNLGISYAQVVGSPDSPFLFSLGVKGDAIYKFRENTWISGTVNTRVVDNFGKYNYDPPPTGLQPVRTDIRQYMTQSIATMPNLQITNTGKLADNHFVSAYAGYLEMMFAGAGGEYLWRPTDSRIAAGIDVNRVRQRQFNVWTSMQNYSVTTGHATAYWDTGVQDILVKMSYGKYLAGDVGGTLDVSRVFQNGVKVGAYATRTNVNYSQFGEGSFDKGVYISVPFDAFFARHSDSSANMLFTPLIRDGGAMLFRKYRLYDMTRTRDPRALSAGPD